VTLRLPPWIAPAAVALGLLSGWLAIRQHDARVAADALAETRRARLDSLEAVLEVQRANVERSDREALAARVELDAARADAARRAQAARTAERAAEIRVVDAGRDLDATLDSLETQVGLIRDPLASVVRNARAQLETERQAHAAVAVALRAQVDATAAMLAASDSTVGLLEGQVRVRDALIGGLEESLAGEHAQALYWQRRADPPWHVRARLALPWALGTAAAAVVAWEIAR